MNSIHNAQSEGEQTRLGNGETEYIFVGRFSHP